MNIGGILICRMDSQRMPGKVLHPVAGTPLLQYVVRRCRRVAPWSLPTTGGSVPHAPRLVIATSDRSIDDPFEPFASEQQLGIFRGSTHNVADRVRKCARQFQFDAFVRINGDSPWLDPALVQAGLEAMRRGSWQMVTNLKPRSYPYGVSLEVVRTSFFVTAYRRMTAAGHFEHVTKSLYEEMDSSHYMNIRRQIGPAHDVTRLRMTVDTPEDLRRFETVVHEQGPDVHLLDWHQVLSAYDPTQEGRKAA